MLNKNTKLLFVIMSVTLLAGCATIERAAIPSSKLISPEYQKVGTQSQISHQSWTNFLQAYTQLGTDGIVRVNYGAVTDTDRQSLDAYIQDLSSRDPSQLNRDTQLAYWINLYNAETVKVILENYPVESIRDIKKGLFDIGPWNEKRLTVEGRELSLYDIENGIVRPLWPDIPEIHYGFNCAAIGCPNLEQTAYTAFNVQQRLQDNAQIYVNHPRGVTLADDGDLTVSKIYNWYRGDFGKSDENVISHLKQFAKPDLKAALGQTDKIDHYVYDWSLNDTATAVTP